LPVGDNFGIGAAYSFIDAETRVRLGAAAVGPRPAQVPRHFANISAEYGGDGDNLQAGVNIRYVGSQFEDDGNSRLLADALTADALISHRLTGGLRAELRGENLFDAQVDAAISGAGIIERANPRTIWLSLQWGFN
jgi:outer membrane receptor protein involved in Fe transport